VGQGPTTASSLQAGRFFPPDGAWATEKPRASSLPAAASRRLDPTRRGWPVAVAALVPVAVAVERR
jgi:hypothetical protein